MRGERFGEQANRNRQIPQFLLPICKMLRQPNVCYLFVTVLSGLTPRLHMLPPFTSHYHGTVCISALQSDLHISLVLPYVTRLSQLSRLSSHSFSQSSAGWGCRQAGRHSSQHNSTHPKSCWHAIQHDVSKQAAPELRPCLPPSRQNLQLSPRTTGTASSELAR